MEIKNIITSVTKENNIIFIRNGSGESVNDLHLFANLLDLLEIPIILITMDGDRSMPTSHDLNDINNILVSKMIIKWFTQNYDKSIVHPKLTYIPIGFNLHTPLWLVNNSISEKIKYMVHKRNHLSRDKRISNKILMDAHNTNSHPERRQIYNLLKYNKNIIFLNRKISFVEITDLYNKFNFVLSPRGNGLDCHRTWELLLAGVIVITKTSSLDEMYIENNLPVVILKDWNELNDNIEKKLEEWYTTHIYRTSKDNIFPKLTFDYWLTK
jgi:hypothetical protein